MNKDRIKMAESILSLTLELLFRLTGEDYIVAKKTSSERCQASVSEGRRRTLSPTTGPPSRSHEEANEEKILELTNKIIELLTGEVPIRCHGVYFSMEESKCLEGHKELYKDIKMEDQQTLISPVTSSKRATAERCPSPLLPRDGSPEHVPQDDQLLSPDKHLNIIKVTETYVRDDEQSIEDIPDNCPDDCTRSSEEHLKSSDFKTDDSDDTFEEHVIILDIPSALDDKDLSSDSSQSVKQNKGHRIGDGRQRARSEEKPFPCSECGKSFKQKSDLGKHQRIHTGEKPFSCSDCGKCFIQKSDLVIHQRIHTGEKPFSCVECKKSFKNKSAVVRHQKTHKGEKPFSCLECKKYFSMKSALIRHQKGHSGERPFPCPECDKRFNRKSHLLYHQKLHTVEKP
ncbi:oocyte zinc finger protein XlCOF8.4-like [Bufo bufo]|uniref:oocyte zinc finger protein XlCOF8.4-like n=1 Tax=Bufo bufo TaxID=8384 RepID=UPI001ABEDB71|nr:oocyte zinc finger protein XlCOF8.4-like [Bufo bufo]XP_040292698.1 oocyte zinc finger protein XlCOF8.4-like [Bufo bufo]XP_040292699.1 oocyte zinc finger protein XlCOF8.4-like [Bufo bufo]